MSKDKGGGGKGKCGGCSGDGGSWVQDNGQKASKMKWQRCGVCNGTGKV